MAETKTTSTSNRGRKKTTTEDTVAVQATETSQADIIAQLMAQIEAQNKQMAELQNQIANAKAEPIYIKQDTGFSGKKIKCINLMHNTVNISTEPNGQGRVYTFDRYGDSRMIKFDELSDIVSSYPYTMEHGLVYICNQEVVDQFGLSDEYATIYTREMIDEIVFLREEYFVDLFIGMEKNMQESTAIEIARKINENESMDYNYLRRIKNECGIDIEKIAEDLKEESEKARK